LKWFTAHLPTQINMEPISDQIPVETRKEVIEVMGAADLPDFKPSKLRFVVALLQCLSCGLNGFILQTYVAIWWIVSDTYAVESTKINWMSMVYAVMFIPGSMLSIYLYAKFGLSYCLIGGALLNFASTWIRAIGGFSYNAPDVPDIYGMYDGMYAAANISALAYPVTSSVKASNSFSVQLFGQILGALGQPLLLNAPPRYDHTAQINCHSPRFYPFSPPTSTHLQLRYYIFRFISPTHVFFF
jgi:hypothetical protein